MEAVVSKVEKPVVHPQGITEIPSLHSVTQAISVLCKQTKIFFVYIKFPFGLMDYNGLKQLQLYHCDLHHKVSKKEFRHGYHKLVTFMELI